MKTILYGIFFYAVSGALATDSATSSPLKLQLQARKSKALSTTERVYRALEKYGLATAKSSGDGSIDLISGYVDVEYVGKVGIGTPPQYFSMDFDTGSSDIWVPSTNCTRCGSHALFNPALSSTFSQPAGNNTWQLQYGDGSTVRGVGGQDTLDLGGLKAKDQVIGLVDMETMDLAQDTYLDGIFGLGFPSLSYTGLKTPVVEALRQQGVVDRSIVSFWLGRSKDAGRGEVMFGASNPAHYEGELKYVPVSHQKYWQVDLTDVSLDGKSIMNGTGAGIGAIMDTGTTLIVLPTQLSRTIHSAISGAKYSARYGWRVPCKPTGNQKVVFKFGQNEFPLDFKDLARELSPLDDPSLCFSGIAEAPVSLAIIGDTFLRRYYSVFDYENSRVGLALSKS
ncbi:hypothetical protein EC973_007325 [Apophysomyces ossiformis]|uniref:rhizopuspepsin n=1 Tax=Apophysomyces ossiformis TaxID=679940 RepID=A0A8H7BUF1_9FUNG|nr:hypothetical protein EC973_007325 [Apophysomyces ossiformis]